jgi:dCMP deaminase
MADKIENIEGNIVIDSIRNPEEVEVLRTIPNFILIAIDAHQKLRHQRASKRSREGDPISTEEFRSLDAKDIDIGIHDCIDKADHIIYNVSKSIDGLKKELEEFVETEKRPSKDEYYLNIALAVARRSTCIRLKTGAIIVNRDQILSTGYNGAPRGSPNCIDLGFCARIKHNVPSGTRYEFCRSVHSEENAMLHSTREQMIGGTIYIAGYNQKNQLVKVFPCMLCQRKVMNAGVKRVVTFDENGIYEQSVEEWVEEAKKDPLKHLEHPEYTSQPKPLKTN